MKATKLSVIFLYILISGYADCARTDKRSEVVKKDKFTIFGTGSSNEFKTKIDLRVETTDGKPLTTLALESPSKQPLEKPVSATKQGKAPPKVPPSQSTVSPAGQVGPTQGSQAGQKAVPGSKANKPGAGNEGTQQPNLPVQSTVSPAGQVGPTRGSLPGQNAPSKNNPAGPTVPGSKANKPGAGNEGTQQPNLPVQSTVSPAGQVGPTRGSLPGQNAPSKNNPAGPTVPGSKANKPGPGNVGTQQPNLPGNVPSQSPTTKPPLSNQVTSPSATKKKGKSYQVTPKPPTNEKPQIQVPKKTPLATTQSVNTPLPSQVANKGGPSAKRPMPTPTPTGVSTGVNSATPTPLAQTSKTVPITGAKSKEAMSSSQTTPLPVQTPSSLVAGPSKIQSATSKGPVTPSATQSAINKVTSSPIGVAPASSVAPPNPAPTNTATTPALPTSAPAAPFSREENIALTEHNFYRAMHKSHPIELNKDLVLEARQYAKKLSVRGTLARETSDVLNKIGQGESLGMVCSKVKISPARAIKRIVDTWYGEACLYNFEDPDPMSKKTARFTQLVWNGSNQLGIGIAEKELAGKYCVFVVARYKPQGNINDKEQFKINVKKGVFDHTNECTVNTEKRFFISSKDRI